MPATMNNVESQMTDAVTQASVHVLGQGVSLATTNAYLGKTHAQNVLFANMVFQQQQSALLGIAGCTRNVSLLLGRKNAPQAFSPHVLPNHDKPQEVKPDGYPVVT